MRQPKCCERRHGRRRRPPLLLLLWRWLGRQPTTPHPSLLLLQGHCLGRQPGLHVRLCLHPIPLLLLGHERQLLLLQPLNLPKVGLCS